MKAKPAHMSNNHHKRGEAWEGTDVDVDTSEFELQEARSTDNAGNGLGFLLPAQQLLFVGLAFDHLCRPADVSAPAKEKGGWREVPCHS